MRHRETDWSRTGRHTGLADIPLLPAGQDRAFALQVRLGGLTFGAVYSSPLSRARETARLAGFRDPILDALLVEWDYGDYEGITGAEIRSRRPTWDLWRDGCPGGEDPAAVMSRARRFIKLAFEAGSGTAIAFSHGHFLRALTITFLGIEAEVGARLSLQTAAISVLREQPDGERSLELWNDTGHLPGSIALVQ